MLKALRTLAARFASPTFERRRTWAGSIALTCHQTGEEYSLIPAGGAGFLVAGSGARYLGAGHSYGDAIAIVEGDARDMMRADLRLAA